MTYTVVLKQPLLKSIAEDCGLIVDNDNREITQMEIEFFAEAVVQECILAILEEKPEDGSTMVYNHLAQKLKEKFNITM